MFGKKIWVFLANLVALFVSFLITYVLRFGWESDEPAFYAVNETMVLSLLTLSFLIVQVFYRPKAPRGKLGLLKLVKDAFINVVLMAAVFSTLVYTSHIGESIPRMFFAYFFVCDFVLIFVCSLMFFLISQRYISRHKRKTVVLTDEADKEQMIRRLMKTGRDDFEVIGVVAMKQDGSGKYFSVKIEDESHSRLAEAGLKAVDVDELKFSFTEENDEYKTYIKKHLVDLCVLMVERLDRDKIRDVVDAVGEMGIETMMTIDSLTVENFESRAEDFGTMQVIRYAPRIFTDLELFAKRAMDIIGGLVGCVLCIIVGIFVVPLIFFTDGAPVIFKQTRVGKNGKYFSIYKFRSMYKDAEERRAGLMGENEMKGGMFKMKNDPRITPVGKFLRKTSLDEFPQFFNVLKGDMSLVGTRPPMVDEYEQYSMHHKRRLSLKPGITGLWQVSGRSKITDFEDVVRLDCYYIDHWSVLYDVKILLMTVGAVLTGKGSE